MSAPFVARYSGTCSACDGAFPVDTIIRLTLVGAVHDRCPEPAPRGEVCLRCFIEKSVSGDCGCDE